MPSNEGVQQRASIAASTPQEVCDALIAHYDASMSSLAGALKRFVGDGVAPTPQERRSGAFTYPELRVTYDPDAPPPQISRSFGKLAEPGVYASSITKPAFFRDYLLGQLSLLQEHYDVAFEVGPSAGRNPIPLRA